MRFITEDTNRGDVKDPLSLNLYTYCQGNPVKYYDPTGNGPELILYLVPGAGQVALAVTIVLGVAYTGWELGKWIGNIAYSKSNETKDKVDDKKPVIRGKKRADDKGEANSVYEQVDNEDPDTVVSRTTYDENGNVSTREDYNHTHYDKTTSTKYKNHMHIYIYNSEGQVIGVIVVGLP